MSSVNDHNTLHYYFEQEMPSESEPEAGRSVGFSGPLGGKKRSVRLKDATAAAAADDGNNYVEITLDVRNDAVAIQSVHSAGADPEAALLSRGLERRSSNVVTKLKQVGQEFRRLASSPSSSSSFVSGPRRNMAQLDRTKSSTAQAIKGLQFVTKNVASEGWPEVDRRFNELAVDGMLLRSRFGKCIGEIAITIVLKTQFLWNLTHQFLSKCRNGGIGGVRRRGVRRTCPTARHHRHCADQGGTPRILGAALRPKLRCAFANLL